MDIHAYIKNMTDDEVISEFENVYGIVNTVKCYSASDVELLDALSTEMFHRQLTSINFNFIPQ